MNTQERVARAMYHSYAEVRYSPADGAYPRWYQLSDREQCGWLAVADMTFVLVNAAKCTGKGLVNA